MSKKILKINANPLITSECWTYYKMAVMQTVTSFDMWIANHMAIYMNENGSAVFGNNGYMYPLSYFCDILEIKEKDVYSVSSKEIVQYLVEQIDKGYYIILDLNYKKLYDSDSQKFWLHETLIYGYDTEKEVFFTPLLKSGSFKEVQVKFKTLCKAYDDSINYYLSDENRKFNRRLWFFGITLLKPKKNYKNTNALYDFINKVRSEKEGHFYERKSLENSQTYIFYTGLSCLKKLAQMINNYIDAEKRNEDNLKLYKKTCLKLYQNQNIILYSMNWFLKKTNSSGKDINLILNEYSSCCEHMSNNVWLFMKYYISREDGILLRIAKSLDDLYSKERDILERFILEATKAYIDILNK